MGDISFLDGFGIPSGQGEHDAHLEKFCADVGVRAVPLLSLAPVVGDVGEGEALTISSIPFEFGIIQCRTTTIIHILTFWKLVT